MSTVTSSSTRPTRPSGMPASILLVEASAANRLLISYRLAQLGCRAEVVTNSLEALQALRGRAYDVVLVDIHMPGLDGLEAARRLRREARGRQPRIIAITDGELRDECLAAGVDDFISKPFLRQEFIDVLQKGGRQPAESGL